MRTENAFTLVETLIALCIASLVMVGIYMAINTAQISTAKIERKVTTQHDARGALELMAAEIRMASYNPTMSTRIWIVPTLCAGISGLQYNRGIQAVGANSISVEMDIDGTGVVGDHENEIITYSYDSTNGYITRSTNCGGAQPFLGAGASADSATKTVRVLNSSTMPVFRYFDGVGAEIPLSTLFSRIPDIRRIEIKLVVDPAVSDLSGKRQKIIYSTSVIPRNHILLQ